MPEDERPDSKKVGLAVADKQQAVFQRLDQRAAVRLTSGPPFFCRPGPSFCRLRRL